MATFESLESKLDNLAEAVAEMRGELKGKLHESPCTAITTSLAKLQEKHIRPLEDSRERVRGALWAVGALGATGAVGTVIEVLSRLFR